MNMIQDLKQMPLKRRDVGLAGAIIILSQFLSGLQSSNKVSDEIIKFKDEYHQSQVDLEKFFVRKSELSKVVKKLDKMNDQLVQMNEKIESMKEHEFSLNEEDEVCARKTTLRLVKGI